MKGKCRDCKFCFANPDLGYICADVNYGESVTDTLNVEKECYTEGLDAFVERTQREEIVYLPNTKLSQVPLDGRRVIYLVDSEEKMIRLKASKAKELFGEIIVLRMLFEDEYLIDCIFNGELFKGNRYIELK